MRGFAGSFDWIFITNIFPEAEFWPKVPRLLGGWGWVRGLKNLPRVPLPILMYGGASLLLGGVDDLAPAPPLDVPAVLGALQRLEVGDVRHGGGGGKGSGSACPGQWVGSPGERVVKGLLSIIARKLQSMIVIGLLLETRI